MTLLWNTAVDDTAAAGELLLLLLLLLLVQAKTVSHASSVILKGLASLLTT